MLRIGIDIGGTFTDFVTHDPEKDKITTFKILSDPQILPGPLFTGWI
jgi:N-methylhydantoinase A/oxoprolinase/acetone carboxylase beta subunit